MKTTSAHLTITSRNGVEFDMPFPTVALARKRFVLVTNNRRFPEGTSAVFVDARGKRVERVLEGSTWITIG